MPEVKQMNCRIVRLLPALLLVVAAGWLIFVGIHISLAPTSFTLVPEALSARTYTEYHGNTSSLIFHRPGCRYFNCKNCTMVFKSREEVIEAGYRPCKVCKP